MSENLYKKSIIATLKMTQIRKLSDIRNICTGKLPTPEDVVVARKEAEISLAGFQKAITEYIGPNMTGPDTPLNEREQALYLKETMGLILETDILSKLKEKQDKRTPEDIVELVDAYKRSTVEMWHMRDKKRMKEMERGMQKIIQNT